MGLYSIVFRNRNCVGMVLFAVAVDCGEHVSGRKEFKSALKAQLWCRGVCCFIQDMVWGMKVVFCQVLHPQF